MNDNATSAREQDLRRIDAIITSGDIVIKAQVSNGGLWLYTQDHTTTLYSFDVSLNEDVHQIAHCLSRLGFGSTHELFRSIKTFGGECSFDRDYTPPGSA